MAKTWLITGSSRHFGWELAKAALERGGRVVATARRPEQLEDLVRQYGDGVRALALDVTDAAAPRAADKASKLRAAEAEQWAAVSRSADFAVSLPRERYPRRSKTTATN